MILKEGTFLADRYRIDAHLGSGGMANVYKVWDFHRSTWLAMKVLQPDLAEDRVFVRRFKREADNLSRLQHPNIVRFYGMEKDGDLVYLLMDYVDGISLRTEISRSEAPLTNPRILQIIEPICSALAYAHKEGVVHCDVKPANIMIEKMGKVYLTDFGIARLTEGATTMTMAGAGTPAYMAPEQVRGEMPTPQTDIYALGIVLYEMLTGGERPFTGEKASITGTTAEKVRWEQLNLYPTLPRVYNPKISCEVEAVIMKCLEKISDNRFSNVVELLDILQEFLRESSVSDLHKSIPINAQNIPVSIERKSSDSKRFPLILISLGATVVIIIMVILGGLIFYKTLQELTGLDPTQMGPDQINTIAAATVQALTTQMAPPPSTATPGSNETKIASTETPEPPMKITPSEMVFFSPTKIINPVECKNMAFFVSETVPDGTVFQPGESFIASWILENSGTCTWTTSYKVVIVGNDPNDPIILGDTATPVLDNIAPGEKWRINVHLIAPDKVGRYRQYWKIMDDQGNYFGIGDNALPAWYIDIKVK